MGDEQNLEKKNQDAEAYVLRIDSLLGALKSEAVRWLIGREKEIAQNSSMSDQTFKEFFSKIVKQEAERSAIVSELSKKNGGTIKEIALSTRSQEKSILRHMIALMKKGSVVIAGQKGDEYLFNSTLPPE